MISQVLKAPSRLARHARPLRLSSSIPNKNAYHHLGTSTTTTNNLYYQQQRLIPLLQHSPRVRFFSNVAPSMVLHNQQIRSIAFSSVPRMALSALRLPTLVAGTTVAGVTLANNKITGK